MVKECHRSFDGWACSGGHRWAVPAKSCQVRLCAFEMRARAMRAFHRMEKPLAGLGDARYLVLTQKNAPLGSLGDSTRDLFAAFERLRHMKIWRWVRGAVCVLEVTFNREARTWHPHLNVIFDGPFLPQRDVSAAWRRATRGEGEIVWIERANGPKTALEVFKYVTKLSDIADVPEAVAEFLTAMKGMRFIRTYGSLYSLPVEEDFKLTCPDCGTREISRLGFVPSCAVELDGQGVLRFDSSFLVGADSSPPFREPSLPVELPTWPAPVFPLSNPAMEVRL